MKYIPFTLHQKRKGNNNKDTQLEKPFVGGCIIEV